ncbi:hypothetical protein Taro_054638 [Colocasia esculenta]|uniref:UspA domain-containing protein n=1 Tax=Colocasia esculenta TaxID=4460 RepID=A0A843XRT0_COLES|nr:hypothetical protein [Colocasia esculenta]
MAAGAAGAKERRIVVAVDEGDESMHALSWCLKNVVADGAPGDTLVLLHAKPTRTVYPSMDGTGYLFSAEMMTTMDRCSSEVADAVVARAKQACQGLRNVKVETKVEAGNPRDVICETVEKVGADTLVMGSHGYGPIKRAFMGSVSSHCAKHVKCPVLIVKK